MLIEAIKQFFIRDWQRFRRETKGTTDAFCPRHESAVRPKRELGPQLAGALIGAGLIALGIFFLGTGPEHYGPSGLYRVETFQGGRSLGSRFESGESLNESASRSNVGISWFLLVGGAILFCKFGIGLLQALSDLDYFQRLAIEYSFNVIAVGSTTTLSLLPGTGILVASGVFIYGLGCLCIKKSRRKGVIYAIEGAVMLGVAIMLNHNFLFRED